jgi:hypothetical protein
VALVFPRLDLNSDARAGVACVYKRACLCALIARLVRVQLLGGGGYTGRG